MNDGAVLKYWAEKIGRGNEVNWQDLGDGQYHLVNWPSDLEQPANMEELRAEYAAFEAGLPIRIQIKALEAEITERRKREAILTDAGKQWLANKEAEIEALRAQLG